ncbi:HRDC domain-containing protein [Tomitella gaofuii]|uniref:HRDC domain-containing protein n=1 Tax=Tomitella gaofuii TaxID=2760083 RepID=UPI0015F78EA9|nr:HRDC domain-containing protein [Tomitella gaofuii]
MPQSPQDSDAPADEDAAPPATPLRAPREGVPPLLTSAAEVAAFAARLAEGTGPVAVDTERASGYRYSGRAYVVQLRRTGAGSALIDPTGAGPLDALARALNPLEWVLHSADQDLPCLAEIGLRPAALFDTELAGRLLNQGKVNLAAMVEREFGLLLAKQHGAADWSRRPLPADWLNYAALDVELLVELRDALAERLRAQGKAEWARQEFEHIRTAPPPAPRPDRWRKTSGIHKVRGRRRLAAVRAMWTARDTLAESLDRAPGRVLPDSAIVEAARADPATVGELRALTVFGGPRQRKRSALWLGALAEARALPDSALPPQRPAGGVPPAGRWPAARPEAADRLAATREAVAAVAEAHDLPAENVLEPKVLRELCWDGSENPSGDGTGAGPAARIDALLHAAGARDWQRALTAEALAAAFRQHAGH